MSIVLASIQSEVGLFLLQGIMSWEVRTMVCR